MIYIYESGDGNCKIGCSSDPEKRKYQIEHETGLTCTRFKSFPNLSDMFLTEKEIHKSLARHSIFGEWFSIGFASAETVVSKYCEMEIASNKLEAKVIPVIQPTKEQREWLDKEKKRTGNSEAAIVRGLIQKEIENV